ncbi:hypothetical protein [Halocynthiibacter styelae]|uniref:Uncharacterized protein n=1 Tax=Halocynthiibacter styelae TaxID=2761955 RepID=A0A8J7IU77_9RHOB|nr:hypothetical protein [Paenihalocynthiibacter styelae]MBI1492438.1 hypothetical protein [Paenihalocynthiibacter styelae]
MGTEGYCDLMGGANKVEIAGWLRISRNNVDELLGELGVLALGRKYPWRRVIEGALGVEAKAADDLTNAPLMTISEAAEELGQPVDGLKAKILDGQLYLPPLYVFGPKRNRFVQSQLIECSRNPRNTFTELPLNKSLFLTSDETAGTLGCTLTDLEVEFGKTGCAEPKHVILTGGVKWYFKSEVQRICSELPEVQAANRKTPAPEFSGGVLGTAARFVVQSGPD